MSTSLEDTRNRIIDENTEELYVKGGIKLDILKRVFDVVFAALGLLFMLLPMGLIAALIYLESPGPAIYKQERLGYKGVPFVIYKFRSMHADAEINGPQWAAKNDKRTTRLGAFLRKTRLDELPQLWNILVGNMSIVGPRPEREYFYNIFEKDIPDFRKRMLVKPGLTGWAQVNGGYDLGPEEKIVYDLEYMQNRSIGMDLKCIFRTVKLIFTHEGAR